ncbi:hypothetical protein C8Q74DRAFT_1372232 [Fomes fomentarius]|nr:hypothetical protein C8Q74DRAFT_1372232 [Fomes fomentarius]
MDPNIFQYQYNTVSDDFHQHPCTQPQPQQIVAPQRNANEWADPVDFERFLESLNSDLDDCDVPIPLSYATPGLGPGLPIQSDRCSTYSASSNTPSTASRNTTSSASTVVPQTPSTSYYVGTYSDSGKSGAPEAGAREEYSANGGMHAYLNEGHFNDYVMFPDAGASSLIPSQLGPQSTRHAQPLRQQLSHAAASSVHGFHKYPSFEDPCLPISVQSSYSSIANWSGARHTMTSGSHSVTPPQRSASMHYNASGAINPALLNSEPAPAYRAPQSLKRDQEQPQLQYPPDAATAGALGLGTGMQVHSGSRHAHFLQHGDRDVHDLDTRPSRTLQQEGLHLRSKSTRTSTMSSVPHDGEEPGSSTSGSPSNKPQGRKQSTEKIHCCTWEGCRKSFARSHNLLEHMEKVHRGLRPFKCNVEGCKKSTEGYSRKGDRDDHIMKKHPEISASIKQQKEERIAQREAKKLKATKAEMSA